MICYLDRNKLMQDRFIEAGLHCCLCRGCIEVNIAYLDRHYYMLCKLHLLTDPPDNSPSSVSI